MRFVPALLLLTALSACTVGPNYAGPPATASDAIARGNFVRASDPALAATPAVARWWEPLGDPTLTALIDDALAQNPTIDQAQARIREAQAQYRQIRAAQMPSVSGNATYLRAKLRGVELGGSPAAAEDQGSTNLEFYNAGLNASWELDLFGAGRRRSEQGRATIEARFADLADAQVSLSAQVAQSYVGLREVQEQIRLSQLSSALQARRLTLMQQRFRQGAASQLDVDRFQAELENSQAQAIPLNAQRDAYLNQLAVLTGRAPGALDARLQSYAAIPLPPAQVPISDPAALIVRRPDVRSAERQLAAATAGIGFSMARELPAVRFLGLLGLGGPSVGDLFDLDNLTVLAAPQLSWSFLDFGKARAATRQSEAQRDAAEAQYRQAVLEALQDAENALSRFGSTRLQVGQLAQAEATAARTEALNRQRVSAGTSALIDQLEIERQRLAATLSLSQAKARLTDSYIAIQKALGLGWSEPAAR